VNKVVLNFVSKQDVSCEHICEFLCSVISQGKKPHFDSRNSKYFETIETGSFLFNVHIVKDEVMCFLRHSVRDSVDAV